MKLWTQNYWPGLCLALLVAPAAGRAAIVDVDIVDFGYVPDPVTVNVGDTVRWTHRGSFNHTTTSGETPVPDGRWDSGNLSAGQTFSFTFATVGTFPYFCVPHSAFMFSEVVVQPAANVPPTVSLTEPTNNAVYSSTDTIPLQATANDADGTVVGVEFFAGATSLGTDTTLPYEATASLAPGSHSLTAAATDDDGATTVSTPVTVFVNTVPIDNPIVNRIPKGDLTIELRTVADGLSSPLGLGVPDDGSGRAFVYDQSGTLWVLTANGLLTAPMLDIRSRLVTLGAYDERGLLGLAVHPNFAQNPLIYTYTSEPNAGPADFTSIAGSHNHQSVIAEWRIAAGNSNLVDVASRRELLRIDQPQSNHNGGAMHFGPDGMMYIALGDGGAADDQGDGHVADGNAQTLTNIYGSLLRMDVDGNNSANGQYGLPADNPFVGQAGLDEIYAYGLRNPFSFSFDQMTDELYLADVGQNKIEEINLIVSGGNYGWRIKEGTFFFDPNGTNPGYVTATPVVPVPPGLMDPIAEYDHDDGFAVVGGYVYRGAQVAAMADRYIFGDWGSFGAPSGRLYYLDAGNVIKELRIGPDDRPLGFWIKGFGQDASGELYVMGSRALGPGGNLGRIMKIVALPDPLAITDIATTNGNNVAITWTGGTGPFAVQQKRFLDEPLWMNAAFTEQVNATLAAAGAHGFFRIKDTAQQPPIPLTAHLTTNAAGVTSTSPTALGSGTFSLDGNTLKFDIEYHDLGGPATSAHIHGPARTTNSAGVMINLQPFHGGAFGTSGLFSGTVVLTAAQQALVLAGQTYVNVHTSANSGGEIRGQIVPVLMTADLSGRNVTSSIETPGHGIGVLALVGNKLNLNVTYRDLKSPATMAHIHGPATMSQNAGVLVNLAPFHGGTFGISGNFAGTATLTPAQLAAVIDGRTYVNVHTTNHSGGEIRGQILPAATATPLSANLSTNAAGVVGGPAAMGSGLFSLEGDVLTFSINYNGLSGPATLAHIHGPAAPDASAGVLVNLAPFNGGAFGTEGTLAGTVALTALQKEYLLTSQTYVNVHTGNHPGGEIRGQITPVLMSASLSGANERPNAVATLARGSGIFTLVGDQLGFNVSYVGLSGPATGGHIHGPASAFQTANVLVDLEPFAVGALAATGSLAGTATLTPTVLAHLINGLTYVNLHTSNNTGGEIRGAVTR